MDESQKDFLVLNSNGKNHDISSISNKNSFIQIDLATEEKSILSDIKDWKIIGDNI